VSIYGTVDLSRLPEMLPPWAVLPHPVIASSANGTAIDASAIGMIGRLG
jgi:hypothetical protein